MYKFGVHSFVWSSQFTNDSVRLIEKAGEMGFSLFEIPLLKIDTFDTKVIRKALSEQSLEVACTTGLSEETDISDSDIQKRKNGIENLKARIEVAAELGSEFLCGVIYSAFGKNTGRPPTEDEYKWSAECLSVAAEYAQKFKIKLGLEPVNRYETNMINTAQQAIDMIQRTGMSNMFIHLDTYHMNIEEKDFKQTIIDAKDYIGYIHLCENDRGIPGSGVVDWEGVFSGLKEIDYRGFMTIESFVSPIPELAAATCIWRKLADSGDVLAAEGKSFLQGKADKYELFRLDSQEHN